MEGFEFLAAMQACNECVILNDRGPRVLIAAMAVAKKPGIYDFGSDERPVVLHEDEKTGDRFLVYGTDKGLRLDIRYAGETLWMTQAQTRRSFSTNNSDHLTERSSWVAGM